MGKMGTLVRNEWSDVKPLIPGGNKKVTHASTNLHLLATSLFKYVWPSCHHQKLKG